MAAHEVDFAPFVEDDVPFEKVQAGPHCSQCSNGAAAAGGCCLWRRCVLFDPGRLAGITAQLNAPAPSLAPPPPPRQYLSRMRADGAWAGNMEVVALSRLRGVSVCIHQAGQPPWVAVAGAPGAGAESAVHLAYEGELHYDSVRRARAAAPAPCCPRCCAAAAAAVRC